MCFTYAPPQLQLGPLVCVCVCVCVHSSSFPSFPGGADICTKFIIRRVSMITCTVIGKVVIDNVVPRGLNGGAD